MLVTYIHHSSFLVELSSCCYLFDFDDRGVLPTLPQDKKLYVFVSHAHNDHYSPKIFMIRAFHPDVTYILSDDIACDKAKDTLFVSPDATYELDGMRITTLTSSDEGVAFLIEAEITIYHAGDLNWWHWAKENSYEENEEAKTLFMNGIQPLANKEIDVAFLPLDPRLEAQYMDGFDVYMRLANIRYVFCMHFWKKYRVIDELCADARSISYRERILHIKTENELFSIEVS